MSQWQHWQGHDDNGDDGDDGEDGDDVEQDEDDVGIRLTCQQAGDTCILAAPAKTELHSAVWCTAGATVHFTGALLVHFSLYYYNSVKCSFSSIFHLK